MNITHVAGTAVAFDAVVAGWDDKLHCEMATQTAARCQRPAHWRLNLHGCEQASLCGQHLSRWQRDASMECRLSTPRCAHCGRQFERVTDAYTVTPL